MPKQVTFIHAADLHFGAPFRGLASLSPFWENRLLSAIPESYDRVIDAAIRGKVDFVIIAGDIFDSAKASYADHLRFLDGLKRLEGAHIPAYLCTGNHDPYTSWQQESFPFPQNTVMLPSDRPGYYAFEKEGEALALIGGRGFYNQSWPLETSIAKGVSRKAAEEALGVHAPFAIGILHTGLYLDPLKAPTDPKELLHAGMDYWALGHLHLRYTYPKANPKLVFPGCIQGRDIKETGERGVFKVTLTEGRANQLEFIPTASVVWQRMSVDVSACKSLSDVYEQAMREMFRTNGEAHCEEMCVRITLVGATRLHGLIGQPEVLRSLRKEINDTYPVFYCDTLVDKTTAPFDKAALAEEGLFPSVLLQAFAALKESTDDSLDFLQGEFLRRGLQLPHNFEKELPGLLEEAEGLALDLLCGSGA